jgi:hypothetical protein
MALSFNDMKRSSASSFDKLNLELTKLNTPTYDKSGDVGFWKPTTGKDGNGFAVIRFLPASEGEDIPFVRLWSHGFKGPTGQWYIENSLTTLGADVADPVSELNKSLWNSGIESDKETVRKQKRKLSYYSNIYVVKDPGNKDNEGKVFKFKYGKKIWDKINDQMNPPFPDKDPYNPFDFWAGANFSLRVRQVEGYPNYDSSSFENPSQLAADDLLEGIWKQQYSLNEIVAPKQFKTYDELKRRLDRVLNGQAQPARGAYGEEIEQDAPWKTEAPAKQFKEKAAPAVTTSTAAAEEEEEDEDELAYFKRLADSDD